MLHSDIRTQIVETKFVYLLAQPYRAYKHHWWGTIGHSECARGSIGAGAHLQCVSKKHPLHF